MVAETVVKESKPFSIEDGKAELSKLTAQYESMLADLNTAAAASDVSTLVRLGGEMGSLKNTEGTGKIDRLIKRIARAENGDTNLSLAAKIEARKAAFNALQEYFSTEAANPVRQLLVVAPGVKVIKVNIEDGKIAGFDVTGGFRQVTAQGIKRPRAIWMGISETPVRDADGKVTNGLSSVEVRSLYGQKYGQVKSEADMSASERNALLAKIVDAKDGENLVNINAAK